MARSLASIRAERERNRRYDAEDALERRTYRTRDAYGRDTHMIDWSRESIKAYEAEQAAIRATLKAKETKCPADASFAPTSTRAARTPKRNSQPNLSVTMMLLLVFGPMTVAGIIGVIAILLLR